MFNRPDLAFKNKLYIMILPLITRAGTFYKMSGSLARNSATIQFDDRMPHLYATPVYTIFRTSPVLKPT